MTERPLIVDVKRSSLDDGPGIRTVVFFKGCPLRCVFCHNPEAQELQREIAFSRSDCILCGSCLAVCDRDALDFELSSRIHRDRCNRCGKCVDVCPGNGLRRIGEHYSVESLTDLLLQDLPFYRHSRGGVTLSGGECTLFPSYLEPLTASLRNHGVHVALQTSGYFNYRTFRDKILPHVDLIFFDIKFHDPEAHRHFTGVPNRIILSNFKRLIRETRVEVRPRIPLVRGITAGEANLLEVAKFVRDAGADRLWLLPYNPLGRDKYLTLGRPLPDTPEDFMTPEEEREIRSILGKGCA